MILSNNCTPIVEIESISIPQDPLLSALISHFETKSAAALVSFSVNDRDCGIILAHFKKKLYGLVCIHEAGYSSIVEKISSYKMI